MAAIIRESIGVNPILLRKRTDVEHRTFWEHICQTENRHAVTVITTDLVSGHFGLVGGHYHDTRARGHVVDYCRRLREILVIVVDHPVTHKLAVAAYFR